MKAFAGLDSTRVLEGVTQRPAFSPSRRIDRVLLGAAGTLAVLGLVMLLDAGYFLGRERFGDAFALVRRQFVFVLLGAAVAAGASWTPSWAWRRLAYPALGLGLVLLAAVLVPGLGVRRGGAQRWLDLGVFVFEPSELMKPIFVLYLAHSLTRKQERLQSFAWGVLPHLVALGVPVVLLLAEPDFGAAAVLTLVTLAMLVLAGARPLHVFGLGLLLLPPAAFMIWSSPYRAARVVGFLDPFSDPRGKGFQIVQSFLAFGNGGALGSGLGGGRQKLFYLPEGHTDFIYALTAEAIGAAGCLVVLVLFGIIAARGVRIGLRGRDRFAVLLGLGLTVLLVGQAVLNLGVVTGLLPTKGLPLPFLSYGGSATIVTGAIVGVLLSLSRESR